MRLGVGTPTSEMRGGLETAPEGRRAGYLNRMSRAPELVATREDGSQPLRIASLLDIDADLAAVVPDAEREAARRRAVGCLRSYPAGRVSVKPADDPRAYGLLVVEGLIGARVSLGQHAYIELLGPGDILRPWARLDAAASVPSEVGWRVFDSTTVLSLDHRFAMGIARWPALSAALLHRSIVRTRQLGFQLALAGIERVDERLLIGLWHFADRWGRVTPKGRVLRLPLTQSDLAEVVHATRQSVSSAVSQLRRDGVLDVDRGGSRWILCGQTPPVVEDFNRWAGVA